MRRFDDWLEKQVEKGMELKEAIGAARENDGT
jgi:hypothetical protein